MAPRVEIYDHTKYLKKSQRRRTFFGQSVTATTFFVVIGILLISIPFGLFMLRISGAIGLPTPVSAVLVLFPIITPALITFALLESRTEGESFWNFVRKKWNFRRRINYRQDDIKGTLTIGLAPKQRIVEGETLFMSSLVAVPDTVTNRSGYKAGEIPEQDKANIRRLTRKDS